MIDSLDTVVTADAGGVQLRVRSHPGARRNAITGVREGELCVAVTAPPDRGRANDAIVELLAQVLEKPRSAFSLVAGVTSRHKRFVVGGTTTDEALSKLAAAMPPR